MNILLTGVTGQLGYELYSSLQPLGTVVPTFHPKEKTSISKALPMDLTDGNDILQVIEHVKPKLIVNAAAYTDVDKAESDVNTAMDVNCHAPWVMAEIAASNNIGLVHYSTDYVYPGTGDVPFTEDSGTEPINVYGKTKVSGDYAIIATDCPYLIFRTSWVYGSHGNNFVKSMLAHGKYNETLKVVDDQIGAPTCARSLANITANVLTVCKPDLLGKMKQYQGVYHAVNYGETSWYGFANKIFDLAWECGYQGKVKEILPIPSEEYKTHASRPKNSRLSCLKLQDTFGFKMGHWEETLEWVLPQIMTSNFI